MREKPILLILLPKAEMIFRVPEQDLTVFLGEDCFCRPPF